MMLGLLLARAGVRTLVLEKHADFLRDFRGDTIHPSTLEVMHELGLLEALLRLPHQKIPQFSAKVGDRDVVIADLTHLPARCGFIAMMPQWDFLDFLAREARRYPGFELSMNAEVTSLVERDGRICGVKLENQEILADLVIGADGRHSTVRAQAGLQGEEFGVPMDVLWFRLSRKASDPEATMGRFTAGRIVILLNRGDYWQCGYVISKGAAEEVRRAGLPAFRAGQEPDERRRGSPALGKRNFLRRRCAAWLRASADLVGKRLASAAVLLKRMPCLFSGSSCVNPFVSFSRMNQLGPPGVLARTVYASAIPPLLIHCLLPLIL